MFNFFKNNNNKTPVQKFIIKKTPKTKDSLKPWKFKNRVTDKILSRIKPPKSINNKKLEVDVPGDGSCMLWSTALGLLTQLINKENKFTEYFIKLFGQGNLKFKDSILKKLKTYNGKGNKLFYDGAFGYLIEECFRQRIADIIDLNIRKFAGFSRNNIYSHVIELKKHGKWCGDIELRAIELLLNIQIKVKRYAYESLHKNKTNLMKIELVHVPYSGPSGKNNFDKKDKNHYRFHIKKKYIPNHNKLFIPNLNTPLQKSKPINSSKKSSKKTNNIINKLLSQKPQRSRKRALSKSQIKSIPQSLSSIGSNIFDSNRDVKENIIKNKIRETFKKSKQKLKSKKLNIFKIVLDYFRAKNKTSKKIHKIPELSFAPKIVKEHGKKKVSYEDVIKFSVGNYIYELRITEKGMQKYSSDLDINMLFSRTKKINNEKIFYQKDNKNIELKFKTLFKEIQDEFNAIYNNKPNTSNILDDLKSYLSGFPENKKAKARKLSKSDIKNTLRLLSILCLNNWFIAKKLLGNKFHQFLFDLRSISGLIIRKAFKLSTLHFHENNIEPTPANIKKEITKQINNIIGSKANLFSMFNASIYLTIGSKNAYFPGIKKQKSVYLQNSLFTNLLSFDDYDKWQKFGALLKINPYTMKHVWDEMEIYEENINDEQKKSLEKKLNSTNSKKEFFKDIFSNLYKDNITKTFNNNNNNKSLTQNLTNQFKQFLESQSKKKINDIPNYIMTYLFDFINQPDIFQKDLKIDIDIFKSEVKKIMKFIKKSSNFNLIDGIPKSDLAKLGKLYTKLSSRISYFKKHKKRIIKDLEDSKLLNKSLTKNISETKDLWEKYALKFIKIEGFNDSK
ncbi:hypothetical protein ACFL2K_04545, partial [Candidatus Margulisiibacteriota bacterium]